MTLSDLIPQSLQSISLGSLFSKKADSYIGIDIGSSAIKLVELKKERGQIILQTYGEVALGPYANEPVGSRIQADPDVLAQALIDVLKEAHTNSKTALVSVQSSASLVFLLRLPKEALSALDSVVPNEARKYIPVPLSEVTLNWQIIPQHIQHRYADDQVVERDDSEKLVLVAAIRNDAIAAYRNIMGQAGMDLHHMEIEAFSSLRSIYHNELTPFALVDVGASQTRIAIIHYGMVMQYDVTNQGGHDWTASLTRSLNVSFEKAQELKHTIGIAGSMTDVVDTLRTGVGQLENSIKKSMSRYEQEHTTVIEKIVMVGGGSRMPGLIDHLTQSFGAAVEAAHPFAKTTAPQFLEPVLDSVGPEFATAVGVALQGLE